MRDRYDVVVIGGGPAGLAAAIGARERGADVLVVEREGQLGGILRQCVHDGFGLERFGEALTGPEYAARDVERVRGMGVDVALRTFVLDARGERGSFELDLTCREGIRRVGARALVLATGCRERTSRQVFIQGDRPAGIFTAGCAQNLVNVQGMLPGKRVVVLGSGDIGLIMARRLTLEGAQVVGVYEAKPRPSGLARNVAQCLGDFGIPLHLSTTVTKAFGKDRLEAVEVCQVDGHMRPVAGTEQVVPCDTLVLSVGLIPENELAERLGVPMDAATKGPLVDQGLQTLVDGIYCAGNCLSVSDLVDYVSECGLAAGGSAARQLDEHVTRDLRKVVPGEGVVSCVPNRIDLAADLSNVTLFLRADGDYRGGRVMFWHAGREVFGKRLRAIRQAETIRIEADLSEVQGDVEVMVIGWDLRGDSEGERHG